MKYLRRLIGFIVTRLLAALIVLGMLTVSFYFAMNATNIYIIIKDGMARRAQVVMMDTDAAELSKYFSGTWIARDELVNASLNHADAYENCKITGFDHRLTLNWVWCWPWDDTARATATERIPAIDGRGGADGVPKWQGAKYEMILSRENGNWKIKNITMLEYVND